MVTLPLASVPVPSLAEFSPPLGPAGLPHQLPEPSMAALVLF
jgi:hypothetical protein